MKSTIERNNWRLYHTSFKNVSNQIITYIQDKYVLPLRPRIFLVYQTVEQEFLLFNIGFFNEDNKGVILRDLKIKTSSELFIQYIEEVGIKGCNHISDVYDFFDKKREILLDVQYKSENNKIYFFTELNRTCVIDDIGKTYQKFINLKQLKDYCVPNQFLRNTYKVVGVKYSVSFSASEINCILFAETNNEHDDYAIKILRWFPMLKHAQKGPYYTDSYEFGYISREQNHDLHDFMCNNDSRILFGTVKNNFLSIEGNFSDFAKKNKAYFLPQFILNYIK